MAARPNRISKQTTNVPLRQLIDDYDEKRILIPEHQREYRWDLTRQQKFIKSIMRGYPIPSILLSSRRADIHPTLEDGRQRITTASRYRNDMFPVDGKCYSALSEIEHERFDTEQVTVITFSNATDDDRIQIFDWHQNGAPLTPGERYHAQHATPLVRFVKEQLMTPGSGYHDRAAAIWGVRGDPLVIPDGFVSLDNRRTWLLNAVALVLGLTFGPGNVTKKYEPEKGFMTAQFPPAKQAAVKKDLVRIFEIFEEVEREFPTPVRTPKKWHTVQWDLGNFVGYIVYSLSAEARAMHKEAQADTLVEERVEFEDGFYEPNSLEDDPEEWARIKQTWVDYIVGVRRNLRDNATKKFKNVLQERIHAGTSSARSWNLERWSDGYNRVFGLHHAPTESDAETLSDEDEV
jgi:hypothetical protein